VTLAELTSPIIWAQRHFRHVCPKHLGRD